MLTATSLDSRHLHSPEALFSSTRALAFSPSSNRMTSPRQTIHSFLQPLVIEQDQLAELAVELSKNYKHLARHSLDQFLATPVNVLPHGQEKGRFLAIDVGGSNLRVGLIELLGVSSGEEESIRNTYEQCWPIEDHLKMDKANDLFAWIGDCIAQVVKKCIRDMSSKGEGPNPLGDEVPMGITFSFPMIQTSISEARLMTMGKGFAITSDSDLGRLLLTGYERHLNQHRSSNRDSIRLPTVKIAAITNDAVATLASLAYSVRSEPGSRVAMGLIVGTGTNATTFMKLRDLHPSKRASINLPTGSNPDEASVAINTEWSLYGCLPPLKRMKLITKWDSELDRACDAPGFQPFEYMSSGRYLGELVRLVFRDYLTNMRGIDPASMPEKISRRNGISTFFLSRSVAPATSALALVRELEAELPSPAPSPWRWTAALAEDLMLVARRIQNRAAHLMAAATIGALICSGDLPYHDIYGDASDYQLTSKREELVIAYAGGVIEQFPGFKETCQAAIDHLVDALIDSKSMKRVSLRKTESGGIIGAGVLAGTVWNLSNT